jgi:tripartite-type tricarboxylate transporter receptor subunit TctC
MKRLIVTALGAVMFVGAAQAAEDYPNQTITIMVPFAPGGIVDIAARIVGEELSERLGQQVVVENRTGGNGFIAAQAALQADRDGYTLLAAESGVSLINELIFDEVPYSLDEDFIPITTMSDTPIVLAAHIDTPADTVEEFVQMAQAEQVNYASPANGTLNHITGEWMAIEADLNLRHIGYRGGAPAGTALASGEVPFGILAYSSVLPYVDSGDIKFIAVTSAERAEADPELPTIQEGGIPNVDTTQWSGIFATAGTPDEIVDKLHAEIVDILNDPDVQARFAQGGARTIPQGREDFVSQLERQREEFRNIVEVSGIEME